MQYWTYAMEQGALAIVVLVAGLILLILGPFLLFFQSRAPLWFALALHAAVAPPHIYRLIFMSSTPTTVFHFLVVCLVVPITGYLLFNQLGKAR
jgi:hypothetical protein